MTRQVPARALSDAHLKRRTTVTIGDVSGTLAALLPVRGQITVVLLVGGSRAVFQLDATAVVKVEGAAA